MPDLKCDRCGLDNPDGVKYCTNCGSELRALQQPEAAQQTSTYAPQSGKGSRRLLIAAIVGVLALVLIVFVIVASTPTRSVVPVLNAYYDDGTLIISPSVGIIGGVYNNGSRTVTCWLNYTISDSRGWNISEALMLGPIPSNHGFAQVNVTHNWPATYNGISITNPTQIVPEWSFTLKIL